MDKEFVPYELALELKQLGFDEPCISNYTSFGKFSNDYSAPRKYNSEFELGSYISAPTYSQAFRWFRENYGLCGHIKPENNEEDLIVWEYIILTISDSEVVFTVRKSNHTLPEKAELECLKQLIGIVK